ncbi:MAG: hypothetical protein KAS04_05075 [Candidatus Aenigmarchaeota archaeon]|nr:hypothetical protein [Candidatus Aenigmarchaeota archaeon]
MVEHRKAKCAKHGVCSHVEVLVCEKCTAENIGNSKNDTKKLKEEISEALGEARKSVYMGETTYVLAPCDYEALQKISAV